MSDNFFSDILPQLPYLLTRKDIKHYFGNVISPRYLANLDSAGLGPDKIKVGNKVAYPREGLVSWFKKRSR